MNNAGRDGCVKHVVFAVFVACNVCFCLSAAVRVGLRSRLLTFVWCAGRADTA